MVGLKRLFQQACDLFLNRIAGGVHFMSDLANGHVTDTIDLFAGPLGRGNESLGSKTYDDELDQEFHARWKVWGCEGLMT